LKCKTSLEQKNFTVAIVLA